MASDPLIERLDDIEAACQEVAAQLEALEGAIREIRQMRRGSLPVAEIIRGGPGPVARRQARSSWSRLNAALHAYRVQAIRCMVDEEHHTIAEVARVTGNARQVVSRLYHSADAPGGRRKRSP